METSIYSPNRSSIDEMRLMSEAGDLAASPFSDNESALEGMKLMFNNDDIDYTNKQDGEKAIPTEKKISNKENTSPLNNKKDSSTKSKSEKPTTRVISDRAEVSTSPIHNVAHLKNLLYQFGNENSKKNNQIRVGQRNLDVNDKASSSRSKDTPRVSTGINRVTEMRSFLDQLDKKKSNRNNNAIHVNGKNYKDVPINKVTEMKSFLMDFEKRNKKQMSSKEFPSASKQRTVIENRMNKVADLRNWLTQMEKSNANSKGATSDQHSSQKRSINIPMNKVNDLRNFLLEFERQNKEHNEKHNTRKLHRVTDKSTHSSNYIPKYQKGQNLKNYDVVINDDDDEDYEDDDTDYDGGVILKLPEQYFENTKANNANLHKNQESGAVFITSPINSVSNLKNWLLDFERKNKEHYENGSMNQAQKSSLEGISQEQNPDQNDTHSLSRSIDTENKVDNDIPNEENLIANNGVFRNDDEVTNISDSRNEKETIFNEQEKIKEMERYSGQEENRVIFKNGNNHIGNDDNSSVSDDSLKKYLDDLDEAMSHTINNEKAAALSSAPPHIPMPTLTSSSESTSPKASVSSMSTGESSNSYTNIKRDFESNKIIIKRDNESDDQYSIDSSQTKESKQSIREKINNHLPGTPRLKFKTMKKKLMKGAKKSNTKKVNGRGTNSCTNPLGQVDTSSYVNFDSLSQCNHVKVDLKDDIHEYETQDGQLEDVRRMPGQYLEEVQKLSEQSGTNLRPMNEMTVTNHNYNYLRPDACKDDVSYLLSPEKSVTSKYEGMMSPDKSFEEEEYRLITNSKKIPYKKSSKNVSEHVGWLKSVYSSPRAAPPPRHPSFGIKDCRRRRESNVVGHGDTVRYLI